MTSPRSLGPGIGPTIGPTIAPATRAAPPAVHLPGPAPAAAPAAAPTVNLPGVQAPQPTNWAVGAPQPANWPDVQFAPVRVPAEHLSQGLLAAPIAVPEMRVAAAPPSVDLQDGTALAPMRREPAIASSASAIRSNAMPEELLEQLRIAQQWAKANRRQSLIEQFLFWSLKIPVIAATAGSAIFAKYGYDVIGAVLGGISAACVLIDGFARPGALRNFHHKAYFELNTMVGSVYAKWQRGMLDPNNDAAALARNLFDEIIATSKEIADYLLDVETTDKGQSKAHTRTKRHLDV